MPNFFEKPKDVQSAIRRSDADALSAMGKKGAEASLKARDLEKTLKTERDEQIKADAGAHAEENRIGWDDDYRP